MPAWLKQELSIPFPEVSYQVMVLGTYDLIVEVFCRDMSHLTKFISKDLQTIPGILSTQTLMVAKMFKLSYLWSPTYEFINDGNHE
jgi:Lrp/AsnC family transcriptional regulator for asnA, asnC and gidA